MEPKKEIRRDVDKSRSYGKRLGISKMEKDVVHRLLSIGKRLVERAEKQFAITPDETQTFDYRIEG